MSQRTSVRSISIAVLLSVTLSGSFLFGQRVPPPDPAKFSVVVAPPVHALDTLSSEAMHALHAILLSRGAVDTHKPDRLFFVGAKLIPDTSRDLVAVSISTLVVLPEEAIEAGKREEVFYAHLPDEKKAALPKEGKWIREMVSEEMLRQYGMPEDQDILIFKRSEMTVELSKFVDNYFLRLRRQQGVHE